MAGTVASNLRVESAEFYASLLHQEGPVDAGKAPRAEVFSKLVDELSEERSTKALEKLGQTRDGRLQLICMALAKRLGRPELSPNEMAGNVAGALTGVLNQPAATSEAETRVLEDIAAGRPSDVVLENVEQRTGEWSMPSLRGLVDSIFGHHERPAPEGPPPVAQLFPRAVTEKDAGTIEDAARTLAGLLADPKLVSTILEKAEKLDGKALETFRKNLAAFAILTDHATTALDYSSVRMGWAGFAEDEHRIRPAPLMPMTREQYRIRDYHPALVAESAKRQAASRKALAEALEGALSDGNLESVLAASFLDQIGVPREKAEGWKVDAKALREAIAKEALIPLRALYDATSGLDHRGIRLWGHSRKELDQASRQVVEEVIQHVVAGDFKDWRLNNPTSRQQLACLGDKRDALTDDVGIEMKTRSGRTLTTREEWGVDLLWFTKIGGPSHGFDMLSQCLLPLLANGRTIPLVVEDDGYADGPAARCYLRVLPDRGGEPTLYLEMLQRDFPHYDHGRKVPHHALKEATIRHSIEKAKQLGVRLAILDHKKEPTRQLLDAIGVDYEPTEMSFVMEPSNAVFEASDSLLGQHHGPQPDRTRSVPVPVFVIEP